MPALFKSFTKASVVSCNASTSTCSLRTKSTISRASARPLYTLQVISRAYPSSVLILAPDTAAIAARGSFADWLTKNGYCQNICRPIARMASTMDVTRLEMMAQMSAITASSVNHGTSETTIGMYGHACISSGRMCVAVPSSAAIEHTAAISAQMALRTRCVLVFFNVRSGLTAFAADGLDVFGVLVAIPVISS